MALISKGSDFSFWLGGCTEPQRVLEVVYTDRSIFKAPNVVQPVGTLFFRKVRAFPWPELSSLDPEGEGFTVHFLEGEIFLVGVGGRWSVANALAAREPRGLAVIKASRVSPDVPTKKSLHQNYSFWRHVSKSRYPWPQTSVRRSLYSALRAKAVRADARIDNIRHSSRPAFCIASIAAASPS